MGHRSGNFRWIRSRHFDLSRSRTHGHVETPIRWRYWPDPVALTSTLVGVNSATKISRIAEEIDETDEDDIKQWRKACGVELYGHPIKVLQDSFAIGVYRCLRPVCRGTYCLKGSKTGGSIADVEATRGRSVPTWARAGPSRFDGHGCTSRAKFSPGQQAPLLLCASSDRQQRCAEYENLGPQWHRNSTAHASSIFAVILQIGDRDHLFFPYFSVLVVCCFMLLNIIK